MILKLLRFVFVLLFVIGGACPNADRRPKKRPAGGGGGVPGQPTPPANEPPPQAVYFIGDSVTAGFGLDATNVPMADSWLALNACRPPNPPDDKCSNNEPGPWLNKPGSGVKPLLSYSYQFAAALNAAQAELHKTATPVHNMAVSGSTPQDWDQVVQEGPAAGIFSQSTPNNWGIDQLPDNALTVLTLGANPLLSRWMFVYIKTGLHHFDKGKNVDCTDDINHAKQCMAKDIKDFWVREHLVFIYKQLLKKGHVLVQKYYHLCPSSFGLKASAIGVNFAGLSAPSEGYKCDDATKNIAFTVVDMINQEIDAAVAEVQQWATAKNIKYRIAAVCPGGQDGNNCTAFDDHQFSDANPWLLGSDTGIHMNGLGHSVMAKGVFKGACEKLKLFCGEYEAAAPVHWPSDVKCPTNATEKDAGCVFISIYNNTPVAWKLNESIIDTAKRAGISWLIAPNAQIDAYDTMRVAVRAPSMKASELNGIIRYGLADATHDANSALVIRFGQNANGASTMGDVYSSAAKQQSVGTTDFMRIEIKH